jgi:uncharacterized protein (DUF433 family)
MRFMEYFQHDKRINRKRCACYIAGFIVFKRRYAMSGVNDSQDKPVHFENLRKPMTIDFRNIITIEPGKRSGKPCIRGLRITVYDILEYFASGMTEQEILEDFDYLTQDDIRACFAYAADREKHSLVISS